MKLVALLFLPICLFGQTTPNKKISLLGNKVELSVPTELVPMPDDMWALKYQKRIRPVLVLTDENGEINLIADMTQQPVLPNQLTAFKDVQIAQLKKRRPDLLFLEDGIKTVEGKKVGYFKFISQAVDQKVFNYYFFSIVNGKILLFTFNCIEKLQSNWEKTADGIVASLKIK